MDGARSALPADLNFRTANSAEAQSISDMAKEILLPRVGAEDNAALDKFWAEVKATVKVVKAEEEWEQQVREQFAADALLSGVVSLDFEHSLKDEAAAAEAAAAPVKAEPEKKKKVRMRCRLCSC